MTAWTRPVVPEATTAASLGDLVMEAVRAAAAESGVTLPERQVVYFLQVPTDCDQVSVGIETWSPSPLIDDGAMANCNSFTWTLRMVVAIVRKSCAVIDKYGNAPSAAEMREALIMASVDAEVLKAVTARFKEIGQGEIRLIAPSGTYQGVELDLMLRGDGL